MPAPANFQNCPNYLSLIPTEDSRWSIKGQPTYSLRSSCFLLARTSSAIQKLNRAWQRCFCSNFTRSDASRLCVRHAFFPSPFPLTPSPAFLSPANSQRIRHPINIVKPRPTQRYLQYPTIFKPHPLQTL